MTHHEHRNLAAIVAAMLIGIGVGYALSQSSSAQPTPTPTQTTTAEANLQTAAERLERVTSLHAPPKNATETNTAATGTRIAHQTAELLIALRDFRTTDTDVTARIKKPAASARATGLIVLIKHELNQLDAPQHSDAIQAFAKALDGAEAELH